MCIALEVEMSKPHFFLCTNKHPYLRVRLPPLRNLSGEQLLCTESDQPEGTYIPPHDPVEQALPQASQATCEYHSQSTLKNVQLTTVSNNFDPFNEPIGKGPMTFWGTTHLVFGVLQVEHEGAVLVLVLAVRVHAQVKHLFLDGHRHPANLALSHLQVVAVTHPDHAAHTHTGQPLSESSPA